MRDFEVKFFKSKDKAYYYARKFHGRVYHYSARSKTKFEYEQELKLLEGCFDEAFAEMYPYCISYLKKKALNNECFFLFFFFHIADEL